MRFFTLCMVMVFLLGAVTVMAQDVKVNFSGEWVLNTEKSEMGEGRGRGRGASKMVVVQEGNKLVKESYRQNRDGEEVKTESVYTLDGKECENEVRSGTSTSFTEWSKDGKTLTIETESTMSRGDQDITMESTEDWSLKDNTLIIERTMSSPMGERESTMVYDKLEKKE
jgi:hypothetical protein